MAIPRQYLAEQKVYTMQLGDFTDHMKKEVNKGSSADAVIPGAVRRAARWLERNYTFKYMDRFVSFTIEKDQRSASIPSLVKGINFMRIAADADFQTEGGRLYELTRVHPRDVTSVDKGRPEYYWLDGVDYFWFDRIAKEEHYAELSYIKYSDWPTSDDAEPWLLENAEDAMIAQTMIMLIPYLREPKLYQLYKPMRDEALRTLINAEIDFEHSNEDARMIYNG